VQGNKNKGIGSPNGIFEKGLVKMIKKFWNRVSFIGLEDKDRKDAFLFFRDIILLNRLIVILELLFLCYLPVEIIFNGFDLVFIIIGQLILMMIPLVLNSKKKFDSARWMFFIISVMVTCPLLYVTPREAANHLFLIPVSLIPIVIFKESWKIIVGFTFVFILFYFVEFTRDQIDDIIDVPLETLHFFSLVFNAMLFLILFMLMFYFKQINRDFEKVVNQNTQDLKLSHEIISERNKDITDSINYAKRIQTAILPPQHFIDKFLKEFFILYKPKDIVAGDFYWAEHVGDYFFIAAADCTGHGVPGAMVSVVCSNALNRAVKEFELTDPGQILDKTTDLVLETFAKSNEEVKDGMDISLLSFEFRVSGFELEDSNNRGVKLQTPNPNSLTTERSKPQTIKWAGANNSLLIIENGKLTEIKANKQPIGHSDNRIPFTTHILSLSLSLSLSSSLSNPHSSSTLFLLTDGFADQFGGDKGKKFKHANLQKLLLDKANLELSTLNLELSTAFDQWKSDLEQVDDVCIIGIRL
jgi:hypothetical protein